MASVGQEVDPVTRPPGPSAPRAWPEAERLSRLPSFRVLVRRRGRLAWGLCGLLVAAFFGFLLFVSLAPAAAALPLGATGLTLGIAAGIGVIALAIAVTGLYVRRANRSIDPLRRRVREAGQWSGLARPGAGE